MGTIRVMSPVLQSKIAQSATLPLPTELSGKTIGFLDNTKTNFELLTRRMETLLRERHGLAGAVHGKKANAATPASAEVLADLAGVDLVITGSAD